MLPADSPFVQLPAPGPHPATDELRAYAAGRLAPAEQHRIEAHTLDCDRCADVVEGFLMTPAATTDQAIATLRTRLQARIGQPRPDVLVPSPVWRRLAAAAALVGVAGSGLWVALHRNGPGHSVATHQPTSRPATAPAPAAPSAEAPRAAAPAALPETAAPEAAVATEEPVSATTARSYAVTKPAASRRRRLAGPLPPPRQAFPPAPEPVVLADAAAAETEAAAPASAAPAPAAEVVVARTTDSVAVFASKAKKSARSSEYSAAAGAPVPGRAAAARMPAPASISPAPVNGAAAMRDYVRRQATAFEPETRQQLMEGIVRVRFMVEPDGTLSNLRVVRGLSAAYDAEALRIVCEGPAWRPGVAGGKRAALPAEVDVSF